MEDLIEKIKEKNPKRVFLQLPEGLRTKAVELMENIEMGGIEVLLSCEPCYGACDLRGREAEFLGADLLVHVGHNKFYKDFLTEVPVLFYPYSIDVDLNGIDFSIIKEKGIVLLTTIQHTNSLDKVSEKLKEIGKEPVIGGQILGCWTENANKIKGKVDAFLFIGSGKFHPLVVKGKTYSLDLEKKKIEEVDSNLIEKKRYANIYKAKDAKSFGILVSTKPGQNELKVAEKIKNRIVQKDKKAFILIMDEIKNDKLAGIAVDAFVNTACPRITDEKFEKPIINKEDLKEVL